MSSEYAYLLVIGGGLVGWLIGCLIEEIARRREIQSARDAGKGVR